MNLILVGNSRFLSSRGCLTALEVDSAETARVSGQLGANLVLRATLVSFGNGREVIVDMRFLLTALLGHFCFGLLAAFATSDLVSLYYEDVATTVHRLGELELELVLYVLNLMLVQSKTLSLVCLHIR